MRVTMWRHRRILKFAWKCGIENSYTVIQEVCRSGRGEGGRMRTRGLGERERWHREEKHNVIIRPHCQTRGRYSPKENFPNICKDLRMMAVRKISPLWLGVSSPSVVVIT